MVTMVGNDTNPMDAMNTLLELEYDAIAAYEAAIERLDTAEYKMKMGEFMADHHRHVEDVTRLVTQMGGTAVMKGDAKAMLTKGKVVMADMMGQDKQILMAMKTNENDTVTAYERMSMRTDMNDMALEVMKRGLADERKHMAWIESTLGHMNQMSQAS